MAVILFETQCVTSDNSLLHGCQAFANANTVAMEVQTAGCELPVVRYLLLLLISNCIQDTRYCKILLTKLGACYALCSKKST